MMAKWRKLAAGSVFVWLANVFIQFASGKWKVRGPWRGVFVLATFLLPNPNPSPNPFVFAKVQMKLIRAKGVCHFP